MGNDPYESGRSGKYGRQKERTSSGGSIDDEVLGPLDDLDRTLSTELIDLSDETVEEEDRPTKKSSRVGCSTGMVVFASLILGMVGYLYSSITDKNPFREVFGYQPEHLASELEGSKFEGKKLLLKHKYEHSYKGLEKAIEGEIQEEVRVYEVGEYTVWYSKGMKEGEISLPPRMRVRKNTEPKTDYIDVDLNGFRDGLYDFDFVENGSVKFPDTDESVLPIRERDSVFTGGEYLKWESTFRDSDIEEANERYMPQIEAIRKKVSED